ncbi:pleckstrin homology domain-containing family F member 2 [Galendromus occidentalis]|uniref:Pleckstrin homology domain-containing family F member 2 n=1 Tax=Galendromus occidentalis TaxID=34638 RepID=A0AAJ7L5V8_9ACAR|nr:pleckstrin homology domain-containing family F member 2 [Galendromus occidentalis]
MLTPHEAHGEFERETEVQEVTMNLPEENKSFPGDIHVDANSRTNTERIQNVENCFGSSGQPLRQNGRVLVGEGVLTKMCRKKPKPRQVFLFNDILVYGNILIPKKKYVRQNIIPLEKVCLENLEDTPDLKNGWVIRTPTKSFVVYAASRTEKQQWTSHINTCINELLKKTGRNPSKEHAAVWVPDSGAGKCMVCKETKFTLINRRHHCRKCGCVVCANCSQHKFMLPAQSSKPVRVCDCCYSSLSMGKGEVDLSTGDTSDQPDDAQRSAKDLRDADTTDDSEEDEDNEAEPAVPEIKEEKWIFQPTFYNEEGAKKDDAKVKIEVEGPPEKVGEAPPKDGHQAVEEKMDQMKITPETNQSEETKADS